MQLHISNDASFVQGIKTVVVKDMPSLPTGMDLRSLRLDYIVQGPMGYGFKNTFPRKLRWWSVPYERILT